MTYTEQTSWHTPPRGTVAQWTAALARHGADDPTTIASTYFMCALEVGLNPDLALAQACHETGWFTSDRWRLQRNPAGIGITSSDVPGPTFVSIGEGIEAHLAHLCCYVYTATTCPIEKSGWHDPRHTFHDGIEAFSTLERPERRWAYPGDGYLAAILAIANSVVPEEQTVSVHKPPLTILDSPNRDGYPGTRRVEALVLHITQGTDSRGWLTSPQSKASANYLIERDGTIYQLVPPDHDAWANGQVNQPDTSNALIGKWLTERDSQGQPINFNQRTISIEHEGMSSNNTGGSLTPAQVASTVALQAWLCAAFNIPPDQDHLLGHYQIDNVNRHFCPGFSAKEWTNWTAQVAALVNPPAPAPAPANNNPGFPGAIGPHGNLVVNGVDFGGSDIVTVEEAHFQVRNSKGERYTTAWVGYKIGPWQRVDPPQPAPDPAPAPIVGGTVDYHDHGPIPLTKADPKGSVAVDPKNYNAYTVYADVQADHAFVVWSQRLGNYLPKQPYGDVLKDRWLLFWQAVVHEDHLKVLVTTSAAGNASQDVRSGFLDFGAVSAL